VVPAQPVTPNSTRTATHSHDLAVPRTGGTRRAMRHF
jgi:hypothetical protein